jgi:ceramide glucosyltransferase
MDWCYYIACMAIVAQVLGLYNAIRNYNYALAKCNGKDQSTHQPRVALIIPCKGLDARFQANVGSFFKQDYEHYHLCFVVESQTDPAYAELCKAREVLCQTSRASDVRILIAGPSTSCSQKIHNLLYAIRHVPEEAEVLAFADSDVCVHRDWLRRLVWPLRSSRHGLTTGYRWFVPAKNNMATLVLSAINASIAQLLGNAHFNQAWGGSMAVRVADFRRLHVEAAWENTLSDDLSLSRIVRRAGMKVRFVPACLVPSFEVTTWAGLCEFARRQFLITRVYAPGTWWLGLVSSLGTVVGLWGSLALALYAAAAGNGHLVLCTAVSAIFFAGQLIRAALRQRMATRILHEFRSELRLAAAADILGSWLWALLLVAVIVSSAFGRTIRWRGIRYRLISPTRTEVLGG